MNLRTPFEYPSIHSSCYGLICFANFYYEPACICNPITREYIVLPIEYKYSVNGFGYSPSTNEFNVVRINWSGDPTIQVYTLGSGIGWRNVGKMDYSMPNPVGFFANGAIYWMNEGKHIILAFDLAKEECREFPSPPCTSVIVELHVLSGSLFACCYHDQGYGCHNKSIWVLKKSESIHDVIWSKEYSDIDIYIRPIAFTKSGGLLCYDHHDKNVYLYSSKASSSRMLVNFDKCFDAQISHKNTLVSLKALGEENTKLMGSGEKQDLAGDTEQSLADELNDFKLAAGLVFTEALRSATLALRSGCILLVLVLQKTKRRVMRFF